MPSRASHIAGALLALTLVACSSGKPKPVPVHLNEDICSECRMAVSQLPFAAEVVSTSGRVDYFDDVGCLLIWLRAHPLRVSQAAYVADHGTGAWVDVTAATYVHAPSVSTPMGFGLLAFGSSNAAAEAAARHRGTLRSWGDLTSSAAQPAAGAAGQGP